MEGVLSFAPVIHQSPVVPASVEPRPGAVVPPPSPVWFPSVMGTGILTTLLAQHATRLPGAGSLALVTLVACWALLVYLTGAFLARGLRRPAVFREALTSPAIIPFWGTVSMGFLSVGSATASAIPLHWPHAADAAWTVNAYLWTIGVTIGILSAFSFGARMVGSTLGTPNFVWGLAVVGPMVAATAGANLSTHIDPAYGPYVLALSMACFVVTFSLGWSIFLQAYHQFWRVAPLPLAAAASSWIPLGLVGQSSAAAQAFARNMTAFADGPFVAALADIANWYGWAMFVVGTPLTLWAALVTIRGFLNRMPFSPGWWATTFPIGTMALGATAMAGGTGYDWLLWLGAFNTLILCGTVTVSAAGSLHAIMMRKKSILYA